MSGQPAGASGSLADDSARCRSARRGLPRPPSPVCVRLDAHALLLRSCWPSSRRWPTPLGRLQPFLRRPAAPPGTSVPQAAVPPVFKPAASEGSPQGGDDEAAGAAAPPPAEPSIRDMFQQIERRMATKEDISRLKTDIGKLATKEDVGRLETLLGSIFNAFAAAVPDDQRRHVYSQPSQLAADCGLPHGTAASRRVLEELLREVRS